MHQDRVKNKIIFRDGSDASGTFLFPDETYMRVVEALGFNRNDGIMSLMPLMCYVHDEQAARREGGRAERERRRPPV